MKLVKDLVNQRIVFYWIDENEVRMSPLLASMDLADEWRQVQLRSEYEGWDRRQSHIDRRRLYHKRNDKQLAKIPSIQAQGRRKSDRPIQISVDHSRPKLDRLISVIEAQQKSADQAAS